MDTNKFHPYQQKAIETVVPLIGRDDRFLISMPAGSGRHTTIAEIIRQYYEDKGGIGDDKILILVDRALIADSMKRLLLNTFSSGQIAINKIDKGKSILIHNLNSLLRKNI